MQRMTTAILLAVGMGVGAAAHTSQARDVTTAPVLLHEVHPWYPAAAMAAKQQGRVALAITVKPNGTVGKVHVTQHLSKELDSAAVKAVKEWRFKPGTKNGKPVPVDTTAELTFTLR